MVRTGRREASTGRPNTVPDPANRQIGHRDPMDRPEHPAAMSQEIGFRAAGRPGRSEGSPPGRRRRTWRTGRSIPVGRRSRSMIAPHEGADGHDAEHEEESGRFMVGPLPEDTGTDQEDQQLLEEPDEGPEVRPSWGASARDTGRVDRRVCWSPSATSTVARLDCAGRAWPGCNPNSRRALLRD